MHFALVYSAITKANALCILLTYLLAFLLTYYECWTGSR